MESVKFRSTLRKTLWIHMKNQSLSIRDQHVNLITNMSITRNRMLLLYIQNDAIKYLKFFVNESS